MGRPPRIGLLLALLSSSGSAAAAHVVVRYQAVPGCPSRQFFIDEVRARTDRVRSPGWRVSVRLEPIGDRYRGQLLLEGPDGSATSRDISSARCDDVASALALVAAVAIESTGEVDPAAPQPRPAASLDDAGEDPPAPVEGSWVAGLQGVSMGAIAPGYVPGGGVMAGYEPKTDVLELRLRIAAVWLPAKRVDVGDSAADIAWTDKEGNWVWGRSWGKGWAVAVSVAASNQAGVIVSGVFDGPLELGGSQYVGVGASDAFLFELDPEGNVVWSKTFGNSLAQEPINLAVGPAGEIALTGKTSGPLDLGGGQVDPGTDAVFVVVYDKDGSYQWSQQLSVGEEDELVESKPSVAFNASGDVIVAGGFRGQVDFGQGPLLSSGQTDVFVAAWSSTGTSLWSYRYGDSRAQAARALSYREGVGLTVAGTFAGTINFGSEMLQASQYGPSAFLVRFP